MTPDEVELQYIRDMEFAQLADTQTDTDTETEEDPALLYCQQPILLQRPTMDADGDVTNDIEEIWTDCGTRFEADCPHCAKIYAKRTHVIISSGLPKTASNSAAFLLTLTAPSYGPVHRAAWTKKAAHEAKKRNRQVSKTRCACGLTHPPDTDGARQYVGAPLNAKTYDYEGQVAFNRISVKLFDSFNRSLKHEFPDFDIQYTRIAEPQRRGAVHFHTVLVFRPTICDEHCTTPLPQQTVSCPEHPVIEFDSTVKTNIETRLKTLIPRPCPSDCETKPTSSKETCPEHQRASHFDPQTNRTYRFGITKDLRPLTAEKDEYGNPSWASTAAYLSKYLTKSSGGEDLNNKISWDSPVGQHIDLMQRLALEQKLVSTLAANKPKQLKRLTHALFSDDLKPRSTHCGLTPVFFSCGTIPDLTNRFYNTQPAAYVVVATGEVRTVSQPILRTSHPGNKFLTATYFLATAYNFFPSSDFLQETYVDYDFIDSYQKWVTRELLGQDQPRISTSIEAEFQQIAELVRFQFRSVPYRSNYKTKTGKKPNFYDRPELNHLPVAERLPSVCGLAAAAIEAEFACKDCGTETCLDCANKLDDPPSHYTVLQKHYPTVQISTITKVFRSLGYTGHPRTSSRNYGLTMTELKATAAAYALKQVIEAAGDFYIPDPNFLTWTPVFGHNRAPDRTTDPPDPDLLLLELEMAA